MDPFVGELLCCAVVPVFAEQNLKKQKLSSEREFASNIPGIVDNTSTVEFWGTNQCVWKVETLIVIISERLLVEGPTDTTTVGLELLHLIALLHSFLRLAPHLAFFTWSKRVSDNSRFGRVLSSHLPCFGLFLCVPNSFDHFSYLTSPP